jgi:hypothetical protein
MPAKSRLDIEAIRTLATRRVEETSLRAVADEIGMSNSGLYSFLQGGKPYSSVRKRLVSWFMRGRLAESRPIPPAEIDAAASLLAAYIRQTAPSGRGRRFMKISEQIASEGDIPVADGQGGPAAEYPKRARRRRSK